MSNEIRINSTLTVQKDNLKYQSTIRGFTADMTGQKGPTPGAIAVSVSGTDVDLSQLTTPGVCEISNIGETYQFDVGVYEPATGIYYPLLEVLPGESYIIRLSRHVQEQYEGSIEGTSSATPNNTVRLRSFGGAGVAFIGAFEA